MKITQCLLAIKTGVVVIKTFLSALNRWCDRSGWICNRRDAFFNGTSLFHNLRGEDRMARRRCTIIILCQEYKCNSRYAKLQTRSMWSHAEVQHISCAQEFFFYRVDQRTVLLAWNIQRRGWSVAEVRGRMLWCWARRTAGGRNTARAQEVFLLWWACSFQERNQRENVLCEKL